MSSLLVMIGVTVLAGVTTVIGACEIKTRHYNAAFSRIAVRDSEALGLTARAVSDLLDLRWACGKWG